MPRSEEAPFEVVNELKVNVGEENQYSAKPDLHKPSLLAVDDVEKPKLIKPKPHPVRPTASSDTNKRYVCVDLLIHFL